MQANWKNWILGLVLVSLSACSTANPLYCDEDSDCSHLRGNSFCDIDALLPTTELRNTCVAAPEGEVCNRAQACPRAERPICNDPSMGECVECTSNEHCEGDCDLETETCVPPVIPCTPGVAGDADCVAADPDRPFCTAADTCSECSASRDCSNVAMSVCDSVDFSCRACAAHAECDSLYCEQDGLCADPASILYVTSTGGGSECSQEKPCNRIDTALAQVTPERNRIAVRAGDYDRELLIDNLDVEIVGIDTPRINPALGDGENALRVEGNSSVSINGLEFRPSSAAPNTDVLRCDGSSARLRMDQVRVYDSRDLGVYATDCRLEVNASTFVANGGGAIDVSGSGGYSITNSVIGHNLTTGPRPAVGLATSGTMQRFDFNTVVGNSTTGPTAGVICTTATFQATGNIVYGNTGGAPFLGCQWHYSDVEGIAIGDNNIDSDPLLIDNVADGNYHLQDGSPCIDAADPAATLATDIDGEARNQGAAPDMGADESQ